MRRQHFELFAPICPVCRSSNGESHALQIAHVEREHDDHIIEGLLHCSHSDCQREYPIIDGIPLIISDIRRYLSDNAAQVCQRDDLSDTIESVIGDCCGAGSQFDAIRQQLSSYTWDHYGDLDPQETATDPKPASIVRLLRHCLAMINQVPLQDGPILDVGCSVGRSTFELATQFDRPVLGIDLNYPMLRLAAKLLRDGRVRYPRRRVGIVYDRRDFPCVFPGAKHVDFWACDATALPLRENSFAAATSMNLLDCVHSPIDLLKSIQSVLKPDGMASIACPYDWSTAATTIEGWLGGHSQRGPDAGESKAMLRRLLTAGHSHAIQGLELIAEDDFEWQVRMHERSVVAYNCHIVAAKNTV